MYVPNRFAALVLSTLLPAVAALRIVHMGDSYSAGNGARDENGQPAFVGPPECFRSLFSWGAQAANQLEVESFDNIACSGIEISEMGSQLDSSVVATADVVLLTVGANDLEFADAVDECLAPPRDADDCQGQIDFANNNLGNYEQDLTALLLDIGSRTKEGAIVIIVAYPHLALDVPFTFDDISGSGEVELTNQFRDFGELLDAAQRRAIDAANQQAGRVFVLFFDETKALFEGHEPHPSAFTTNSDGWIWELQLGEIEVEEVYHPNPEGHAELGAAVANFIEGAVAAPVESNAPSSPPSMTPVSITPPPVSNPTPSPPTPSPGGGGACFSGTSLVDTEHRGTIPISALQIGDRVLSDVLSREYSDFVGFIHMDTKQSADFLQIHCVLEESSSNDLTTSTTILELTPDHFVYSNGMPIAAQQLRPGDWVDGGSGRMRVAAITPLVRQGFYAPGTTSGKIVVNGIQASNYVAFLQFLPNPEWEVAVYHAVLAPWRWYQQLFVSASTNNNNGSSIPFYVRMVRFIGLFLQSMVDWVTVNEDAMKQTARDDGSPSSLSVVVASLAVLGAVVFRKYHMQSTSSLSLFLADVSLN